MDAFTSILQDLHELKEETTEYAIEIVYVLFSKIKSKLQYNMPYGAVSTDSNNNIRIEWNKNNREVRLIISPIFGGDCYIYYETNDTYNIEKTVTPSTLAKWIDWLSEFKEENFNAT